MKIDMVSPYSLRVKGANRQAIKNAVDGERAYFFRVGESYYITVKFDHMKDVSLYDASIILSKIKERLRRESEGENRVLSG